MKKLTNHINIITLRLRKNDCKTKRKGSWSK